MLKATQALPLLWEFWLGEPNTLLLSSPGPWLLFACLLSQRTLSSVLHGVPRPQYSPGALLVLAACSPGAFFWNHHAQQTAGLCLWTRGPWRSRIWPSMMSFHMIPWVSAPNLGTLERSPGLSEIYFLYLSTVSGASRPTYHPDCPSPPLGSPYHHNSCCTP